MIRILTYLILLCSSITTLLAQNHIRIVGNKSFELSNHLGNVLEVTTDRKVKQNNEAEIVAFNDYYPYGLLMEGRHGQKVASNYRYAFQGQEKDDGVKGRGNSYNYTYRMDDTRLGRFFAIDPLSRKYPFNSSYAFSENVVINAVELEGLEKKESVSIPKYDETPILKEVVIKPNSPINDDIEVEGSRREKEAKKMYNKINKLLNTKTAVYDHIDKQYKALYVHETVYGKHIRMHRDNLKIIWDLPLRHVYIGPNKDDINYIKNSHYWTYLRYLKKNHKKIINRTFKRIVERPRHEDFRAKYSFNEWTKLSLGKKVEYYQLYGGLSKIRVPTLSGQIIILENMLKMNNINSQTYIETIEHNLEYYKNEYNILHNKKK